MNRIIQSKSRFLVILLILLSGSSCRSAETHLGYDIVMEMPIGDFIHEMTRGNDHEIITRASREAAIMGKSTDGHAIDFWVQALRQEDETPLWLLFSAQELEIDSEIGDEEVIVRLKEVWSAWMDSCVEVMKKRLNKLGLEDFALSIATESGRFYLQLPVPENPEFTKSIINVLRGRGSLEVWGVYSAAESIARLEELNTRLLKRIADGKMDPPSMRQPQSPEEEQYNQDFPVMGMLNWASHVDDQSIRFASAALRDTFEIMAIIDALTPGLGDYRFMWMKDDGSPEYGKDQAWLLCLQVPKNRDRHAFMDGTGIISAKKLKNKKLKQWVVEVKFSVEGAKRWTRITKANNGRHVAFALDGKVIATSAIKGETVTSGIEIAGGFANASEADVLAAILESGPFPTRVNIISTNFYGPDGIAFDPYEELRRERYPRTEIQVIGQVENGPAGFFIRAADGTSYLLDGMESPPNAEMGQIWIVFGESVSENKEGKEGSKVLHKAFVIETRPAVE